MVESELTGAPGHGGTGIADPSGCSEQPSDQGICPVMPVTS